MIQQKVKGAKTGSLARFKEFEHERRMALLSFDEKRIRQHYAEWNIPFPPNNETFWEAVAKNVLLMSDVPPGKRIEALLILDELNINYEEHCVD